MNPAIHMDYSTYFKFFQLFQDQLSGVYSTATLIISILLVIWVLNFTIGLVIRIFSLGKSIGNFYRSFLHRYIRIFIFSIINLFSKKSLN